MKRFSIFILAILITMGTFPFDVAAAKKLLGVTHIPAYL